MGEEALSQVTVLGSLENQTLLSLIKTLLLRFIHLQ